MRGGGFFGGRDLYKWVEVEVEVEVEGVLLVGGIYRVACLAEENRLADGIGRRDFAFAVGLDNRLLGRVSYCGTCAFDVVDIRHSDGKNCPFVERDI